MESDAHFLFFATAIAELVGCYLPLLWLTGKGSAWLFLPAALSLVVFLWLLSLQPSASGRVYATGTCRIEYRIYQ